MSGDYPYHTTKKKKNLVYRDTRTNAGVDDNARHLVGGCLKTLVHGCLADWLDQIEHDPDQIELRQCKNCTV